MSDCFACIEGSHYGPPGGGCLHHSEAFACDCCARGHVSLKAVRIVRGPSK